MFRIDDPTAATSLPTPEAAGTEGYWTEGNPASGVPATLIRGSWLNMIQEELCSLLAAAGITRSKTTYNQVNAALQKMYAPVIGTVRNLAMAVAAASATATVTADEIVVGTALGGQKYVLPSFNKSINLATVGVNAGVGGMDTGTAPASSFVGIYAIFNPTAGTAALLGVSANGVLLPNVYGGANLPSGYTASALLCVVATNASSLITVCTVADRKTSTTAQTIFSVSSVSGSPVSTNNLVVPMNARRCAGTMSVSNTGAQSGTLVLAATAQQTGAKTLTAALNGTTALINFENLEITTPQRVFVSGSSTGGTATFAAAIGSWEI